jgi:hypothetical protein
VRACEFHETPKSTDKLDAILATRLNDENRKHTKVCSSAVLLKTCLIKQAILPKKALHFPKAYFEICIETGISISQQLVLQESHIHYRFLTLLIKA